MSEREDDVAADSLPDTDAAEQAAEGRPHESSPNPTQESIEEDPEADKPADAPWST